MHNDNPGAGKGLAMFSQYLDISAAGFDTGLRTFYSPYLSKPVYNAWAVLPAY